MARARRRRLRKAIGIETKGGIFTSLIPAGSALPAEYSFILTTADDYQAAVQICVLQGGHHLAARNKKLGVFEVTGFALAPPGAPQIEITFHVDDGGSLLLTSKDLVTGWELAVGRRQPGTALR